MPDVLDWLSDRLDTRRLNKVARGTRLSRHYACRCGAFVHFDAPTCQDCGAKLGYLADERRLAAVDPGSRVGTWTTEGREGPLRFCANHDTPAACNWLVNADGEETYCISCRLTRSIPDLGDSDNVRYLTRIEAAKRRLVSQLLELGPPVLSKLHDDPETGVMFDFLRSPPNGPQVMTGHASGLITLNVEEAD